MTYTISVFLLAVMIILVVVIVKGFSEMRKSASARSGADDAATDRLIETLRRSHADEMRILNEQHERQIEALRQQWEKRLADLDEQTRLRFNAISQDLLDRQTQSLRDDNSRQMESVLRPLREKLESLSASIQAAAVQQESSRSSLTERIDLLARLNTTIGEEARALTEALRGNSKVQGDWGEHILETLLEKAGLTRGVNFQSQVTRGVDGTVIRDEGGRMQRPDFIVEIPGGHKLIIDSKVSLTAYVRLCEEQDAEKRHAEEKKHVASVRSHIDELARKRYQKNVPGSMEYVMMFIPNEGAFHAALEIDPELWKYAADAKVVMVTPSLVLPAMMLVSQLWREDNQEKNAAEIARVGGLLYDSVVSFIGNFEKVGVSIRTLTNNYETAARQLSESNNMGLPARARRLQELGAKTSRKLAD